MLVVFDAYGTLFDVNAVRVKLAELWPVNGAELAAQLRAKQLEYSFLRVLMRDWKPFRAITADALEWVLAAEGLQAEPDTIAAVMAAYDEVEAYPDAVGALERLAGAGRRCAILTNGSTDMVAKAVEASGIRSLIERVLSVDAIRTFKPDPAVYAMVEGMLGVAPVDTVLVSANPFDVAGAARFGFRTCWVRRRPQPFDFLGQTPTFEVASLAEAAALLAEEEETLG